MTRDNREPDDFPDGPAERENLRIRAEKAEADVVRLREALISIARQCACRCDQSWTSRGRHSPDCLWHLQSEADDALAATEPKGGDHGRR